MEKQRQSFGAELSVQGATPKEATSTVYVSTNYMEVVTPRAAQTNLARYRRCSKKEYMDLATGELCTYSPQSVDDGGNTSDGTRGFRELDRILCTNFSGSNSELHITLTVASESQADLDSLQERFRKFWKSFHYRFPRCEYVVIAEPHKSGRYHLHLLVKDREGIPLYVKNEEVWTLWEIGVTRTGRIHNAEWPSAYFCSQRKRMLWQKYHRSGRRLFRCSQGIVRPKRQKMLRKEVNGYVELHGFKKVGEYDYQVKADGGGAGERLLNVITYEKYRR